MSDFRAQANHRLYLARLLLAGWSDALLSAQTPVSTLSQAFEPAVCDHLANAYGWFLLEITQPDLAPSVPPRCCAELPALAAGKVLPGEIREFQQLESEGWVADMLRDRRGAVQRRPRQQNLGTEVQNGPADLERWADQLQAMFDRMSDSLDEY